ncbi:MAG: outer membrane beta-barrel family protein [Muribaculaceae bacterium]|nr:outer membrane beta-barrel family protein [Muribaculaceae bacterium]
MLLISPSIVLAQDIIQKVTDADSGSFIDGCVVKAFTSDGKVTFSGSTDSAGAVVFTPQSLADADSIRYTHYGYMPLTLAVKGMPLTVSMQPASNVLSEVVVTADRSAVTQRIDALSYNVSADPAVRDKTLWEAIGRTPFLITSTQGKISTIPGYNGMEFKLNGLEDPLLRGDMQNVFSSIPAQHISRIDVKEIFTSKGTVLEVNIITKGRIEGITGTVSSRLSDSSWANSVYALTKIKRFALSLGYNNSWIWSHNSYVSGIEDRADDPMLPKYEYINRDHGYHSDNHTYKLNASYDLTSNTVLSAYAEMWGKTNPHSDYSGSGRVSSPSGADMLTYDYTGGWKPSTDREYLTVLSLQHTYADRGYLTGKYQFYGRDMKSSETRFYTFSQRPSDPEEADAYRDLFPDYVNLYSDRYRTHDLQAKLYRPLKHSDSFALELKGRYYIDNEDSNDTYYPSGDKRVDTGRFKHRQLNGYLRGEYYHEFLNKFSVYAAAHLYVYDNHMKKDDHEYDKTFVSFAPAVYLNYMPVSGHRLSLSYEMSRLVPSVTALDPYRNYSTAGSVSYGNPDLDPETRHQVNLRYTITKGRNMFQFTSANRFSNNLMLSTVFLSDGLLNRTYANAASRIENSISVYFQRRCSSHLFFKLFTSANYVNYNVYAGMPGIGAGRNGWYWNNQASATYDFDSGWSIDARATAHTRYIYLQSKGNSDYTYELTVSKMLLDNRLTITGYMENPLPVHKTRYLETASEGFIRRQYSRSYTASFGLSIRYRFGNLRANVKGDTGSISTSDMKSSYTE